MLHPCTRLLLVAVVASWVSPALAQFEDQPPARYEIIINGENFVVEENRVAKLKSVKNPGQVYELAVRFATLQPWRLNAIEFDYDQGFAVRDDRDAEQRRAELKHNLGFQMTVTDLGGTVPEDRAAKALAVLIEATTLELERDGGVEITVAKPTVRKFGEAQARGVVIAYQQDGVAARALAYLVTSKNFACTCVIDYPLAKQDAVLPMVKPTLESFRAVEAEVEPDAESENQRGPLSWCEVQPVRRGNSRAGDH
jgi:hypothetical protein